MWIIDGRPLAGEFPTEADAIARAWELTPPGEQRPKVVWRDKSAVVNRLAGEAHVHITFDHTNFSSPLLDMQMDREGWAVDLAEEKLFARGAMLSPQSVKNDCVAGLRRQAEHYGLTFDPEEVVWDTHQLNGGEVVRVKAMVRARG